MNLRFTAICVAMASVALASAAVAQDKRLDWTKGPYVKVQKLRCIAQPDRRGVWGIATGEVLNVSKTPLNHVEVTVRWTSGSRSVRHKPAVLKPLPLQPGQSAEFRIEGEVGTNGRDCQASVSVR
jgi:hypothetical protein